MCHKNCGQMEEDIREPVEDSPDVPDNDDRPDSPEDGQEEEARVKVEV